MQTAVIINLPDSLVKEMEMAAHKQQRSVSDMARELILQGWHSLPRLPEDIEAELATFTNLSDEVLWLLARSTLTKAEQEELATLNHQAKQPLTDEEAVRREALLAAYDRTMMRRAQAALLLKSRGYDLSDPHVLQPS